jgi:DNA polymerase III subunit epsilon
VGNVIAGPAPETPWRDADLCAIDLETTGLDAGRDEIISFATIPIEGGRVHLAGGVYRVVRPERMPEAETIRIHGLRPEDLAAAGPIGDVLDELVEAISGRALVVHVAGVERGFLRPLLKDAGSELRNPFIDTAELATRVRFEEDGPARRPIALTQLARELGLPVHRPHEADGDALTTAQAFLALATRLDAIEPQTIGSLASSPPASGPWAALREGLRRIGR